MYQATLEYITLDARTLWKRLRSYRCMDAIRGHVLTLFLTLGSTNLVTTMQWWLCYTSDTNTCCIHSTRT